MTGPPEGSAGDSYAKAYAELSRTLKTWLVAYGIGAPVLFMTNPDLWKAVAASGDLRAVGLLFLIGVFLQVLIATVNKTAMWVLYYGEEHTSFKSKRRYQAAEWLSKQFWIDVLIDIGTITLFVIATLQVLDIVMATT